MYALRDTFDQWAWAAWDPDLTIEQLDAAFERLMELAKYTKGREPGARRYR